MRKLEKAGTGGEGRFEARRQSRIGYRCFTARGKERVSIFGDFGLANQLGSAEYGRPCRFRERLAKHVGRWSTTVIGRFYNGRDHSTVCYGIQRIEALRESDPDVDALISDLKHELNISVNSPAEKADTKAHGSVRLSHSDLQTLADLIAERVSPRCGTGAGFATPI